MAYPVWQWRRGQCSARPYQRPWRRTYRHHHWMGHGRVHRRLRRSTSQRCSPQPSGEFGKGTVRGSVLGSFWELPHRSIARSYAWARASLDYLSGSSQCHDRSFGPAGMLLYRPCHPQSYLQPGCRDDRHLCLYFIDFIDYPCRRIAWSAHRFACRVVGTWCRTEPGGTYRLCHQPCTRPRTSDHACPAAHPGQRGERLGVCLGACCRATPGSCFGCLAAAHPSEPLTHPRRTDSLWRTSDIPFPYFFSARPCLPLRHNLKKYIPIPPYGQQG